MTYTNGPAPTDPSLAARLTDWRPDLVAALQGLYGDRAEHVAEQLVERSLAANSCRSVALRRLDQDRSDRPDWYQQPERVGYMAYVDRFGGDLQGVRRRIGYLTELGVDVLHLLSLLRPREGESDGGYAIRDYRIPDPAVGSPDDLDQLVADLHEAGISLCLDFVLNHTSNQHEWAEAARAGSDYHRSLYLTFPDRVEPDAYEATLPEIFPDMAPGSFTWIPEMRRWAWTTFREFQWDLDWSNPDVMLEMVDIALHLANLGVDILRLDAIAFTWKRLGTNCQNQPEAHLVAQALRAALAIAAPATILLAEAIVAPGDLVGYLGRHDLERRECELAYHNQLMVQGWSMLATRTADLARAAISRLPDQPDRASWFTYVRCHDDIGWAIDDADARSVWLNGAAHRTFLAKYYRGDFPMSFGRGTSFGANPATGDERTCGMASTLTGISAGLESSDSVAVEIGVRRMVFLYAIAFGFGGIPIVYMGDELCQGDDLTYRDDPDRRGDTRWCHRPRFDDALVDARHAGGVTGQLWRAMRHLVDARRTCSPLHGAAATHAIDVGHPAVFAWHRRHPRYGDLLGLANAGELPVTLAVPAGMARLRPSGALFDQLDRDALDPLSLDPLQVRWLTTTDGLATVPAAR